MTTNIFHPEPMRYKLERKNIDHYRWMAEHEGQRALRAYERADLPALHHHARDAAHWAIRVLDLEGLPCANCRQSVHVSSGDCLNECHKRGLA